MEKREKKNLAAMAFVMDSVMAFSFAFFPTYLFSETSYKLFALSRVLVQLLCLIATLPKVAKKLTPAHWLLAISPLIPLISTIAMGNSNQISFGIQIFLAYLTIISYATYRSERDYLGYTKNTSIVMGSLLLLNAVTMFIFRDTTMVGRKNFYFLGNDNATIFETVIFILS